jgi:hypothetical protein
VLGKFLANRHESQLSTCHHRDEQAPLPAALKAMVDIVDAGLKMDSADFTYNCQMGRGRTSSGMITASIAASIMAGVEDVQHDVDSDLTASDGDWSEETAYLNGP